MKNIIIILLLLWSSNHYCQGEYGRILNLESKKNYDSDSSFTCPQKLHTWIKFNFGYKLPGNQKYGLKIDGGLWFGAGLNFELSEYFSIQPELNLWQGKEVAPSFEKKLTTAELLAFLSYDNLLEELNIRPYAGLGLGTVNREGVNESLISFNLGTSYRIMIMESILEINLRHQSAGSNNIAGGSGYQSWFLGMSYGFSI